MHKSKRISSLHALAISQPRLHARRNTWVTLVCCEPPGHDYLHVSDISAFTLYMFKPFIMTGSVALAVGRLEQQTRQRLVHGTIRAVTQSTSNGAQAGTESERLERPDAR